MDDGVSQIQSAPENTPSLEPKRNFRFIRYFLVFILFLIIAIVAYLVRSRQGSGGLPGKPAFKTSFAMKKAGSESELREALAEASTKEQSASPSLAARDDFARSALEMAPTGDSISTMGGGTPERISETNVQVAGVDEPDILKTDGRQIYYSGQAYLFGRGAMPMPTDATVGREIGIVPPDFPIQETQIIRAFPPDVMEQLSTIDTSGNLLVSDGMLVVFTTQSVTGYNVSDPANPTQTWEYEVDDNSYIVDSRLNNGIIYMVLRRHTQSLPCPIPLMQGTSTLTIACTDVYLPSTPVPIDAVFTALAINPQSGNVDKELSFTGSSGSTVVYMSENNLYATFSYLTDTTEFLFKFFDENARDLVSAEVVDKLDSLRGLPISNQAKMVEYQVIIEEYYATLTTDERRRIENEFVNRMEEYVNENGRELTRTGIVRIDIGSFNISATGDVAGSPLNQFSLDEYENNLRIATTVSDTAFWVGTSENDVYVLNSDLKTIGSITGLGITERVYSARFVGDVAYLVTFKQIDPFYVLDLADPANPVMKGELKIPGFSSYLHPLTDNSILGIGQEDGRVKLSLFDVSNKENPVEAEKYQLDEFWSEAQNNHHAFLADNKHEVFFLPGGQDGYVFSYDNTSLSLIKVVSGINARRALYLDDFLYIVGNTKIVVLNQNDWSTTAEFDL